MISIRFNWSWFSIYYCRDSPGYTQKFQKKLNKKRRKKSHKIHGLLSGLLWFDLISCNQFRMSDLYWANGDFPSPVAKLDLFESLACALNQTNRHIFIVVRFCECIEWISSNSTPIILSVFSALQTHISLIACVLMYARLQVAQLQVISYENTQLIITWITQLMHHPRQLLKCRSIAYVEILLQCTQWDAS